MRGNAAFPLSNFVWRICFLLKFMCRILPIVHLSLPLLWAGRDSVTLTGGQCITQVVMWGRRALCSLYHVLTVENLMRYITYLNFHFFTYTHYILYKIYWEDKYHMESTWYIISTLTYYYSVSRLFLFFYRMIESSSLYILKKCFRAELLFCVYKFFQFIWITYMCLYVAFK